MKLFPKAKLAVFATVMAAMALLSIPSQAADFDDKVVINENGIPYPYLLLNRTTQSLQEWFAITNWTGTDDFEILSCLGGGACVTPFRIDEAATANSLTVDNLGRVGVGTLTPGGFLDSKLTVTANSADRAYISLPTSDTEWIVGGYPDSFGGAFGLGEYNGALFTQHLAVANTTGFTGIGTSAPESKLHVVDGTAAKIIVQNTNPAIGTKVMYELRNDGGIRFDMIDSTTGADWVFQNQFGTFDVTLAGTGTREFRFYPNGNLEISGSYIQSSSRSVKHDIETVDQLSVLEKVLALPINLWSYNREEGVRHMGPMSEDFYESFGLGGTDKGITTVDSGGVALAAIQGLKQEKDAELAKLVTEKNAQIEHLQAQLLKQEGRLQQQDERMMQLELALTEILRSQSSGSQVGFLN